LAADDELPTPTQVEDFEETAQSTAVGPQGTSKTKRLRILWRLGLYFNLFLISGSKEAEILFTRSLVFKTWKHLMRLMKVLISLV
jgi:hypothetical protein